MKDDFKNHDLSVASENTEYVRYTKLLPLKKKIKDRKTKRGIITSNVCQTYCPTDN